MVSASSPGECSGPSAAGKPGQEGGSGQLRCHNPKLPAIYN